MSQLLNLVTQMQGNEAVTNIIYSTNVHMTDADRQNILEPPTDSGYCARILFPQHVV